MTAPTPLTLVVPVYNEARSAADLPARLAQALRRLPGGSEAILVEDGSTDGTGEVLEAALEGKDGGTVRLLRHRRNKGYGAALKTGIEAARHDLIAIADADGTYPLEALPKLLAEIHAGAAMVVGARRLSDQPSERRLAKVVLNGFASHLAGRRIPDLNSGLRIFRRQHARRHWRMLPDGFSFTTTITMSLLGDGEEVAYVPIKYRRRVGTSKIRPVRDMAAFMLLIARMAMAFNPLRIFGPAGLLLIAAGLALLVGRAFMAHPFGVATTVVLLVGGLQAIAIGLLADLINRRGRE